MFGHFKIPYGIPGYKNRHNFTETAFSDDARDIGTCDVTECLVSKNYYS
jgi:hypothetical protein